MSAVVNRERRSKGPTWVVFTTVLVKSLTTMRDLLSYFGLLRGDRHWSLDGGCTLNWRIM